MLNIISGYCRGLVGIGDDFLLFLESPLLLLELLFFFGLELRLLGYFSFLSILFLALFKLL
jgi:hypothetical protein